MGRFLHFKATESAVGRSWLRRMEWELRRVPYLLEDLPGTEVPRKAADVCANHVSALRAKMPWEKPTFAIHFAALRQFLRWAGNPLADRSSVWRLPSGQPSHRRWLTRSQLRVLWQGAVGPERLLVALEAFNGLRRIEVLRLRAKDLLLSEGSIRVLGKGRDGGKWRVIPTHPSVRTLLARWASPPDPESRLIPLSSSGADLLLQRAARRANFPKRGWKVSHHDLRRTFGRLAHESGMDLVQLKNLYGHASIEMTAHYIGLDTDRMRDGLERLRVGTRSSSR